MSLILFKLTFLMFFLGVWLSEANFFIAPFKVILDISLVAQLKICLTSRKKCEEKNPNFNKKSHKMSISVRKGQKIIIFFHTATKGHEILQIRPLWPWPYYIFLCGHEIIKFGHFLIFWPQKGHLGNADATFLAAFFNAFEGRRQHHFGGRFERSAHAGNHWVWRSSIWKSLGQKAYFV